MITLLTVWLWVLIVVLILNIISLIMTIYSKPNKKKEQVIIIMRDLVEVLDQMIAVIPQEERDTDQEAEDLVNDLRNIQNSATYAAPELMRMWWEEASFILSGAFTEPTKDWHFEMISIFTTKTVEELKEGR